MLTSGFGGGFLRLAQNLAKAYDKSDVMILPKPFRRAELEKVLIGPGDYVGA